MNKQAHSPEVKAAVIAALLTGQAPEYVANQYSVNLHTVKTWKRRELERIESDSRIESTDSPVEYQKKETSIGDLILGLLEEELISLQAMSRKFRESDWLDQQDAAELGVLYGIMQDKAVRKIEVLQRASAND